MSENPQKAPSPSIADQVRSELRKMSPSEVRAFAMQRQTEERAKRYEEEKATRLAKVTLVEFRKPYFNYNAGEIAGLKPAEAAIAISEGFAKAVGGSDPISAPVREDEQQRDVERAQVEIVAKFLGALDPSDPAHVDPKTGRPSLKKLSSLCGFRVSSEQAEAAMAKAKADASARGV